jgi:flavin reductase (DIM6/NTAB) family NADH-FMN oxidoreductase RutF
MDGVPTAAGNGGSGAYDTLFGEVVSAAADERAFVSGRWQFDDDKINTLHHLGTGNFVASGRHVRANTPEE